MIEIDGEDDTEADGDDPNYENRNADDVLARRLAVVLVGS